MNKTLILIIMVLSLFTIVYSNSDKPWMNKNISPSERALKLLKEMTIEDKLLMLHGSSSDYVGYVQGNEKLGIPALKLNDGPQGFRDDKHPGTTTFYPSLMTAGMTWDRSLLLQLGEKMAYEFYKKGANVLLGPGLNLARVPRNGRNFEYLSGADPYLGYSLVQNLIKGIQSQKVIANAKHWVENNQEHNRDTVSANVDERTRFELYYQPFMGAIEADVGSFMCSYNKINSYWSCENSVTLKHDLKESLGFTGWVMSDWGATHSVSINAGLDQEMPGSDYFGSKLSDAVANGDVDISTVDDSVLRILTPMFKVGLFDDVNDNDLQNNVLSEDHNQFTRTVSEASQVLLKNAGNLLPLKKSEKLKIAVVGQAAISPVLGGGGSGAVYPPYTISPYQGLLNILDIQVPDYDGAFDCNSTLTKGVKISQYGCHSIPASSVEECCQSCGKLSGCNYFSYESGNCGLYPTSGEMRPAKDSITGKCIKKLPPSSWICNDDNDACIAYDDGSDLDVSSKLAKEASVVIVVVSQFSKEGSDRDNISFDVEHSSTCQVVPKHQNDLVSTVAATGTPTIVAATAPGPVLMPWKDEVDSILYAGLPGQEYGNALANLIFGNVNPSGKLTFTIPNIENEVGFSILQYPGVKLEEEYLERSKIDYRWYTSNNVIPAYPFGHGLSYTSFEYSQLAIAKDLLDWKVTVSVKNSGEVAGAEVVQLYIEFPKQARAPPLQLKGFQKTPLIEANGLVGVELKLTRKDLSIWDVINHQFVVIPGDYTVRVGSSSSDLRLSAPLRV